MPAVISLPAGEVKLEEPENFTLQGFWDKLGELQCLCKVAGIN